MVGRPTARAPCLVLGSMLSACGGSTDPAETAPPPPGIGILSETGDRFRPDVDTFIGVFEGGGGAMRGLEADATDTREGAESLRATVSTSGDGFAGWFVSWGNASRVADDTFTRDMSSFANGALTLWVKSSLDLELGIRSGNIEAGDETSNLLLGTVPGFVPDGAWHRLCVPLDEFVERDSATDLARVKVLFVIAANRDSRGTGGRDLTFWIDDVRWLETPCP